jgi:hypothetical protein
MDLKLCRTRNPCGRIVGCVSSAVDSLFIKFVTGVCLCVMLVVQAQKLNVTTVSILLCITRWNFAYHGCEMADFRSFSFLKLFPHEPFDCI